jgi:energy-coupling factor transporter ATP-binding protein EcfA2
MSWRGSAPATCWAAEEATAVIPVEAETPIDAVFMATHSSIPVFKRDVVTDAKRITKTNEKALLAAVLEQPSDQPILPILGSSGTGKSHLVRWLRARLPETDTRRVIFVPKHRMSLRGILDLILDRATSELADELRQKVAKAVERLTDVQEAKLRLRNELALLIETRGTRIDVTAEEQELREWLASSEGLPALLNDSVFRDRVFDEQSPISRLAREKLAGRGSEDKEEAYGFTAADFAMTIDDTSRASEAARIVASTLTSDRALRELAAKMLNEQLSPAVSQVFGIGGDDLKDLLVEVRVEFRKQNLELLLLIEDFSIFQGIQGGLLDAITLIPTQDNGICPMRVVMAVTLGYFINEMPDTVYTRVYKVFDLDDPNSRVSFAPDAIASRYMNAIRVGSQALEEAHRTGGETPNACEQCPVNDACHAAFGAVGGYGLFPFNRPALEKAVRSQIVDERLSVRDFLTRVLRPVLFNQHDEVRDGTFPNAGFDNAFRAGAIESLDSIEDEHRLATTGDAELSKRRVVLVRYWGAEGLGPQNLQSTIHEAFGIPPVAGLPFESQAGGPGQAGGADPTRKPSPGPQPQPQPQPQVKRVEAPVLVQAIDRWRGTGLLRQGPRNELRQILHAAVLARLSLEDGLGGSPMWTSTGKQWDRAFEAQTAIAISEDAGPNTVISIGEGDDEDVRALRALAWVNAAGTWRDVDNGEVLQRIAEEKLTAWTAAVNKALVPERDNRDDSELAVAAHTLLAMSKALGIPDAFKDDALSRTRALFAPAQVDAKASRPRLQQWQQRISADSQRLTRAQLRQRVLRLASFTQGTSGSPLALDLPRVTRALRGKDVGIESPASTGLLQATATTVQARLGALSEVRDEATALVPDLSDLGGDLPDVIKKLEGLVAERANSGQLPGAIVKADLTTAGRAIKQGDQGRVEALRARLDAWDVLSVDDRIRALTDDWDESTGRVRQWLALATGAVWALETKLGGGANTAAQVEYDQARESLVTTLQSLRALLVPIAESDGAE